MASQCASALAMFCDSFSSSVFIITIPVSGKDFIKLVTCFWLDLSAASDYNFVFNPLISFLNHCFVIRCSNQHTSSVFAQLKLKAGTRFRVAGYTILLPLIPSDGVIMEGTKHLFIFV